MSSSRTKIPLPQPLPGIPSSSTVYITTDVDRNRYADNWQLAPTSRLMNVRARRTAEARLARLAKFSAVNELPVGYGMY